MEFKTIFEALPGHFLILAPHSPDYTVLAASDELLRITGREREQIVGKSVFEVFPENPDAITATGPDALRVSLQKAIRTKQPDQVPVVRYGVPAAGGALEARYGSSRTRPVLDEAGEVRYLIYSLQENHDKRPEESESRFRHLVGQAPVAFCLTRGREAVIESINAAMLRIMGKAREEEVLGKKMAEAWPEVTDQPIPAIVRKVADTGESLQRNEVPLSLPAGEKREQHYFNVSHTPLIEEGVVTGVIHLATDVTGQVVARQAVEASEARFRSLAQNAPGVITRHGKDYRYLYASPRIEQFTGIRAEDFPGKTYRELGLPETLCALFDEHLAYVFAHQTLNTLEYAMPGGKGYILSRMVPEYNEAGEVDSVLVFSTDISDRKRMEEALRKSEEKYRTLFEAMDEGFFLCEVVFDQADAPVDVYYREANPAATRMVGEGFTGRRAKEIRSGDEADWYGIFGRVARSGQAERLEQYDGSARKWYTLYVFSVGDRHRRKVAVIFKDITERKRREANLAFLADVADAMSRLSTVEEIMATVGAKIGAYLRVKSCSFVDVDDARGEITVFDAWNAADVPGLRSHTLRLSDFMNEELSRAGRAGEVVIVGDTLTDPRIGGRDHTALGIAAYVNVPFHRQGAWTNNLAITDSQPRDWQDDEIELFRELANRIFPRLERARAEAALRESEQQFRLMADAVPQIVWITDPEGHNEFFNKQWFLYTGAPYEPTTAAEVATSFVHPDDGPATMAAFTEARATGTPLLVEHRIRSKAGDYRWFLVRAEPYRDQNTGQIIRWFGASVDIHDRKGAEEVLRQNEARQTYLLKLSDALRPLAEPKSIQREACRVLRAQLGAGQVVYTEATGPNAMRAVATDAAAGVPDQLGAQYYTPDYDAGLWAEMEAGRTHWRDDVAADPGLPEAGKAAYAAVHAGSWANVPLVKDGRLVVMLTVHFPSAHCWTAHELRLVEETAERTWAAAERARAEAALRDSEALLQKAFSVDTVSQLYFTLDGRITAANPAFVRMSGYRTEALLAFHWQVLTAPEFWDITLHAAGELADWGETAPYEKQFVRPDGSRWWGLCAPTRLKGHGPTAECMEFIVDISERKQAEEHLHAFTASLEALVAERTQALRESQDLLQSVFDTSLIIMMVLRAVRDEAGAVQDFRIVMGNRELAKETGRTDLVGKLYSREYPGVRRTRIYELMLGVLETGEPAGLEYYYPHEGFHKWYATQLVKLDDGVVVTNLDITERKLAEEKIREQAHFIARVNETLPDLMTVTELPSGQVLYINRDPHEAPGFEREKVLNIPLEQQTDLLRMHPDDAALLPDYFVRAAALADHEIATYSYRARFNTDQWRWFDVRGSVFHRDPATGAATRLLSVAQDVTARKEAEGQLLKSYQVLRQAEQVAPMGSWEYDRSTGSFTWSEGMYGLFGLSMGSPVRVEIYLDYAVAEDLPVAEKIVGKIKQHRPFEETLRINVDGQEVTLKIKAIVQPDPQGGVGKMLGVDVDLSQVKRLEQENLGMRLQQQQQLLNAILAAQEEERRRISESLHNGVGQILFATKLSLAGVNLAALQARKPEVEASLGKTEALLTEAIVETRRVSHELVPVLLKEFGLRKAVGEFCSRFARTGIQIDCHCFPERLPALLETAIYRISQELVNNIMKHSGATRANLEVSKDQAFVYLDAQDNGRGINSSSLAESGAGKGIGLSTIRDRVKLLDGTLEIDSTPGKGTLITIRLPLRNDAW